MQAKADKEMFEDMKSDLMRQQWRIPHDYIRPKKAKRSDNREKRQEEESSDHLSSAEESEEYTPPASGDSRRSLITLLRWVPIEGADDLNE